jgi:hypothetical protein
MLCALAWPDSKPGPLVRQGHEILFRVLDKRFLGIAFPFNKL